MKQYFSLLGLLLLFFTSELAAQQPTYRYAFVNTEYGTSFFALEGTNGQLFFMNDHGDDHGKWQRYGNVLRESSANSLEFSALKLQDGVVFYAFDAHTGTLAFMPDFGQTAGKWKYYGDAIRSFGDPSLRFQSEIWDIGTRFTAMDANTGQVYFMFDFGEDAGHWKAYGEVIK